jgi:hypothetical protein
VSKKGEKRDPLLDCPNVAAYREVARLSLNHVQRKFVVEKVSCCEKGQRIWRDLLEELMLKGNVYRVMDIPFVVKLWENMYFGGMEFSGENGIRFQRWEGNGK